MAEAASRVGRDFVNQRRASLLLWGLPPQRRVHRLPPIMKVAVPRAQHSPRFGQAAEKHTVLSRFPVTARCTASNSGVSRTRARSQGGFRARPDRDGASAAIRTTS